VASNAEAKLSFHEDAMHQPERSVTRAERNGTFVLGDQTGPVARMRPPIDEIGKDPLLSADEVASWAQSSIM
jgi:hypothetical protein